MEDINLMVDLINKKKNSVNFINKKHPVRSFIRKLIMKFL